MSSVSSSSASKSKSRNATRSGRSIAQINAASARRARIRNDMANIKEHQLHSHKQVRKDAAIRNQTLERELGITPINKVVCEAAECNEIGKYIPVCDHPLEHSRRRLCNKHKGPLDYTLRKCLKCDGNTTPFYMSNSKQECTCTDSHILRLCTTDECYQTAIRALHKCSIHARFPDANLRLFPFIKERKFYKVDIRPRHLRIITSNLGHNTVASHGTTVKKPLDYEVENEPPANDSETEYEDTSDSEIETDDSDEDYVPPSSRSRRKPKAIDLTDTDEESEESKELMIEQKDEDSEESALEELPIKKKRKRRRRKVVDSSDSDSDMFEVKSTRHVIDDESTATKVAAAIVSVANGESEEFVISQNQPGSPTDEEFAETEVVNDELESKLIAARAYIHQVTSRVTSRVPARVTSRVPTTPLRNDTWVAPDVASMRIPPFQTSRSNLVSNNRVTAPRHNMFTPTLRRAQPLRAPQSPPMSAAPAAETTPTLRPTAINSRKKRKSFRSLTSNPKRKKLTFSDSDTE